MTDTETSILSVGAESAMCVQRFDDSLGSAIRITYRISLRSSSLQEPRHPLLKVVSRVTEHETQKRSSLASHEERKGERHSIS